MRTTSTAAATALYYLPVRYYEPATARFLSPDPAPASAGDPLSLNRYGYCMGDPVNASHPTGAVIDLDGNEKLDREDTVSENGAGAGEARGGSSMGGHTPDIPGGHLWLHGFCPTKCAKVGRCSNGTRLWGPDRRGGRSRT